MSNNVKRVFGSVTGITTTNLGGLTDGSYWASGLIDWTDYDFIELSGSIKQGTNPNAGDVGIFIYGGDQGSPEIVTDGISGPAVLTDEPKNALHIDSFENKDSPATGEDIKFFIKIDNPPRRGGVIVLNNTGVALDADDGDSLLRYRGQYKNINDAA